MAFPRAYPELVDELLHSLSVQARAEKGNVGAACALVGMDEVGRGALAGPVSVGAAAAYPGCDAPPAGLTDSKMLSAKRREALCEPIAHWVAGCAVGHASSEEIDRWGIVAALRLAGRRALAQLAVQGVPIGRVLLDGSHNWLAIPPPDLLTPADHPDLDTTLPAVPPVTMAAKADTCCSVVSAASVIAKVERDNIMVDLAKQYPQYGWQDNKGYGSAAHRQALETCGPTPLHRQTWNLPKQITADPHQDEA